MKKLKRLDEYARQFGEGKVIMAPDPLEPDGPSVFLAGSIEMGKAEDWQAAAGKRLSDRGLTVYNPRRLNWDSSWEQSIDNEKFREQVEWELEALDQCTAVLMYFQPETKSPISLLELGLFAQSDKMVVVCPEGFWRKGNVDVVCARYGVPMFDTVDEAVSALLTRIARL